MGSRDIPLEKREPATGRKGLSSSVLDLRHALRDIRLRMRDSMKRWTLGSSETPPFKKNVLFEALEPRLLLAGDPVVPLVSGSIDVPGETDRYTFTVKDDIRVVFDSLTSDSQIQWSLDGPAGNVIAPRDLSVADSNNLSGNVAWKLSAGDYTLSIDGKGDRTGAYAFRIIDIGKAAALTPGVPVTGQLSPANETDAYTFSANAGQSFYFDRTLSEGNIYWRLIAPNGNTVFGPNHMGSDVEQAPLVQTGVYTLLLEGQISSAGVANYAFNVVPNVDEQRTLTLGQGQGALVDAAWAPGVLGGGLKFAGNGAQWVEAPA
ncbi:MAG: LEPR-XLL domain-containing protein, partial [Burkholderiales bacterium]